MLPLTRWLCLIHPDVLVPLSALLTHLLMLQMVAHRHLKCFQFSYYYICISEYLDLDTVDLCLKIASVIIKTTLCSTLDLFTILSKFLLNIVWTHYCWTIKLHTVMTYNPVSLRTDSERLTLQNCEKVLSHPTYLNSLDFAWKIRQ